MAQIAQPVHSPLSVKLAGRYPAAFRMSEGTIQPFGQKLMHIWQPLQIACSISIYPLVFAFELKFNSSGKDSSASGHQIHCKAKRLCLQVFSLVFTPTGSKAGRNPRNTHINGAPCWHKSFHRPLHRFPWPYIPLKAAIHPDLWGSPPKDPSSENR